VNTYDPTRIGEYIKDIKDNGKSTVAKAEELGCSTSTLYSAIQRHRKEKRQKPGPKPKVKVIDVKKPPKAMTLLDRLAIIETQLSAVRETLRSIQ
jgi:transposase-like protein